MRIDLRQEVTAESAKETARRFWHWWSEEMRAVLPGRVNAWLLRFVEQPRMRLGDQGWIFEWPGRPTFAVNGTLPAPAFRNAILRELGDAPREPVLLELPEEAVLRRTVQLPRAALSRLYAAIGLQIERLCPFRGDAVLYSCSTHAADVAAADVPVEVAIVPRTVLSEYMTWLERVGLHAACFETSDGRHKFRISTAHWRDNPRVVAVAFALAGVVLLLSALFLAPELRASEFSSEALELASERRAAAEAVRAKGTLDSLAAPLSYLAEKEREPRVLDVLRVVNAAFPGSARLETLTIDGGHVRAAGVSVNARQLLDHLRSAPHVASAAYREPIERARDGRDRFEVELEVQP